MTGREALKEIVREVLAEVQAEDGETETTAVEKKVVKKQAAPTKKADVFTKINEWLAES